MTIQPGDRVHPKGSPHTVVTVTALGRCPNAELCAGICEYGSPELIEYLGPDGEAHQAHASEYEPHAT